MTGIDENSCSVGTGCGACDGGGGVEVEGCVTDINRMGGRRSIEVFDAENDARAIPSTGRIEKTGNRTTSPDAGNEHRDGERGEDAEGDNQERALHSFDAVYTQGTRAVRPPANALLAASGELFALFK